MPASARTCAPARFPPAASCQVAGRVPGEWPGLGLHFPRSLQIFPDPLEEVGMALECRAAVSAWGDCAPRRRQVVSGDIRGCHGRGCSRHRGAGDRGCCSASHSAQDCPPERDLTPVSTVLRGGPWHAGSSLRVPGGLALVPSPSWLVFIRGQAGFAPATAVGAVGICKHSGGAEPQGGDIRAWWWGSPAGGAGEGTGRGRAGLRLLQRAGARLSFRPQPRAACLGRGMVAVADTRRGVRAARTGAPRRAQGAPPLQARGTPCSTRRRARRTRTC